MCVLEDWEILASGRAGPIEETSCHYVTVAIATRGTRYRAWAMEVWHDGNASGSTRVHVEAPSAQQALQDLLMRARATMTQKGTSSLLQAVTTCREALDTQEKA